MIGIVAGAISGAIMTLLLEHGGTIGGAAIVLAILIFCAVLPFPRSQHD